MGAEHMDVAEQIETYIASQPEAKRTDLGELHQRTLQVSPGCKLCFLDGKTARERLSPMDLSARYPIIRLVDYDA